MEELGKEFGFIWEDVVYKKMILKDVNNYIAIDETDYVKRKGAAFVTEPKLGDSCNFLVIPKAVSEYFINKIPIKEYITNHDNIYDFCGSQKVDKSFKISWNGKMQQRLNRYYVSTKGAYLYKIRKGKYTNMLKGYGVQLFNKYEEKSMKDYNINYRFYISKAMELVNQLEPKQTTLF